jgi:hypothetical protein
MFCTDDSPQNMLQMSYKASEYRILGKSGYNLDHTVQLRLFYMSMLASSSHFFSVGESRPQKERLFITLHGFIHIYQSSSRVALWKHSTVHTRMKKDVNSMNMAPVSIRPACLRIAGMARLPMADAPVRNLAALIHLQ